MSKRFFEPANFDSRNYFKKVKTDKGTPLRKESGLSNTSEPPFHPGEVESHRKAYETTLSSSQILSATNSAEKAQPETHTKSVILPPTPQRDMGIELPAKKFRSPSPSRAVHKKPNFRPQSTVSDNGGPDHDHIHMETNSVSNFAYKDRDTLRKKTNKEHPLSQIASQLFEKKSNIPQNPKTKMKSLFENMLRKEKGGAGSANKHFQFGPDLETISERQSVSAMSFGEGTLFSFNGEENSFYEDQPTTYIGEAQRFSTRSNLQDVLENYTFEERERLAKFLEMEIFACHYNDNFSYFDTVEKLRSSLKMISQTKLLWKKCTKSVIDLDKLKSYAGMNIREISLEDKKVEDMLRIEKSTMTFDQ